MTENSKEKEISNTSKDIPSQIHSNEPPIAIFNKLNSIAKGNFHQIIPLLVCEICYKDQNLIQCKICDNGFPKDCLKTVFFRDPFICDNCRKQFTEEEIYSITNNPFNQKRDNLQRENKIYKEFENNNISNKNNKKKYQINTIITSPTKIIELNEDNKNSNLPEDKNNNIINNNINFLSEEKKGGNLNNNINNINNNNTTNNLNKKKLNKKIIDNMTESNNNEILNEKSEIKSTKKEKKISSKIDSEKNIGSSIILDNDFYESSVMSRSQEILLEKPSTKIKRKREREKDKDKDKELNSNYKIKTSSHSMKRCNSPNKSEPLSNSNIINLNNDISFTSKETKEKEKINKDEQSLQSIKKSTKKKTNEKNNDKESLLLSFTHKDPQYKRRKIKIGTNRQCNMYEFIEKYENKINFDEEEYERNDLIQVWSKENNPLSEDELNKYLNTARMFWNYSNVHIEEDLCADFFQECESKMKGKKIGTKLKNKILKLIKELKELIKRGISLNSHYDEMSLRVLHLCKYKTNIALLFLYKGLNPFVEEVEEGFKHDIYFFQDEIYSFINNGDFFDPDN